MLVFLALVAAASRAHHVPGSSAGVHSPPAGVGDYLFTMFLLVVVVGFLFLIYIWFSERDLLAQAHGAPEERHDRALILIFLFLALVSGVAQPLPHLPARRGRRAVGPFAAGNRRDEARSRRTRRRSGAGVRVAADRDRHGGRPRRPRLPRRRGRCDARAAPLVEQHLLEREFESLVEDTLDDLYANPIRAQRSSPLMRAWSSSSPRAASPAIRRRHRWSTSAGASASCARAAPRSDA